MNILRFGHDTYGERIVNGVSWDLLPVAFWAGVAVIVVHLVWRAVTARCQPPGRGLKHMAAQRQGSVLRHAGIDRAVPLGHRRHDDRAAGHQPAADPGRALRLVWQSTGSRAWSSRLLILLHVVRALFWQSPRIMAIRGADFGEMQGRRLPGKYTLPQKLMHLGWAVAMLVAIVTGWLLMQKAGVPFLERDPYVRSLAGLGRA